MVKSAQDRQGKHTPYPLDLTRDRRVLVKRYVRTKFVVILFVGIEQKAKMPFVEDDDVIKAISADGSDQPFSESR